MVAPAEALHDPDGFLKSTVPFFTKHMCEVVGCDAEATVWWDQISHFCDKHWLYCDKCGSGWFYGVTYSYCPTCHVIQFKEMR